MKKWKWRLAILLAVLLSLTATAFASAPEEAGDAETAPPEDVNKAEDELTGFFEIDHTAEGRAKGISLLSLERAAAWGPEDTCYGDQLGDTARTIYETLETTFSNGSIVFSENEWKAENVYTVTFPYSGDFQTAVSDWWSGAQSEISLATEAFVYDHPEYFWIRCHYRYSYSATGNGRYATVPLTIGFPAQPKTSTQDEIKGYQARIDEVVNQLLRDTADLPVIARLAYWDNWLAAHNHYNSTAAHTDGFSSTDETPWSIVGALLDDHSPVCEGYAKAFQLLCSRSGIPCVSIVSNTHMWNEVRVNGKWYVVDSTWDDPIVNGSNTRDYSSRQYFLVSQPTDADHAVAMSLSWPAVESRSYFTDWSYEGGSLTGGEEGASGTQAMWIALYDSERRLVACKECDSFEWINGKNMYAAPQFTQQELGRATEAVRFATDISWGPTVEKREIVA